MAPLLEKKKRSISLLISALLLVVIVVAGAALIYGFLVGFIGNTTHVPSSIQLTGFCASNSANGCGPSHEYSVTVTNIGGNVVTGQLSLTFQDMTTSFGTFATSCVNSGFGPGSSLVCVGNFTTLPTTGDLIIVTVVTSDGGTAVSETRATT